MNRGEEKSCLGIWDIWEGIEAEELGNKKLGPGNIGCCLYLFHIEIRAASKVGCGTLLGVRMLSMGPS